MFAVLAVTVSGSLVGTELSADGQAAEFETTTLEDGTELYPYTSAGQTTAERTLALNMIVYGDADATAYVLREQSAGEWEELDDDEFDIAHDEASLENESSIAWGAADGSVRYTYVEPPGEPGRWVDESYQLKDGAYLGERHHIRAYADPIGGDWTAMQAHWEHWDWFELRHSVHSIEDSQSYVESEFFDQWYVDDLSREWIGNDLSSDGDGWVSVIELRDELLTALLAVAIIGSLRTRVKHGERTLTRLQNDAGVQMTLQSLVVVASIVALVMAVRVGAVRTELLFPEADPKLIVAVFYPLLICGLPIVAYLTARHLEPVPAFTAAALGFVIAMFLDLSQLGVSSLTLQTFIHRGSLAVALGFIAAGASQTARSPVFVLGHVRTGVLLWIVAVGLPVMRHLNLW
nr:hypothetical protein [Natronolimnobius sp. AArcel1]